MYTVANILLRRIDIKREVRDVGLPLVRTMYNVNEREARLVHDIIMIIETPAMN